MTWMAHDDRENKQLISKTTNQMTKSQPRRTGTLLPCVLDKTLHSSSVLPLCTPAFVEASPIEERQGGREEPREGGGVGVGALDTMQCAKRLPMDRLRGCCLDSVPEGS